MNESTHPSIKQASNHKEMKEKKKKKEKKERRKFGYKLWVILWVDQWNVASYVRRWPRVALGKVAGEGRVVERVEPGPAGHALRVVEAHPAQPPHVLVGHGLPCRRRVLARPQLVRVVALAPPRLAQPHRRLRFVG